MDFGGEGMVLAKVEWPTQLAILQAMWMNDDPIVIHYIDDEGDEIRISDQDDFDFACRMALNTSINGTMELIVRDAGTKLLIGRTPLRIGATNPPIETLPPKVQTVADFTTRAIRPDNNTKTPILIPSKTDKSTATVQSVAKEVGTDSPPVDHKPDQLTNILEKFKTDILEDIDGKFKRILSFNQKQFKTQAELIQQQAHTASTSFDEAIKKTTDVLQNARNMTEELKKASLGSTRASVDYTTSDLVKQDSFVADPMTQSSLKYEMDKDILLGARVHKLLASLLEARKENRPLKCAYLEEELMMSEAFNATCSENTEETQHFVWSIHNKGKVDWNAHTFPVQLVCCSSDMEAIKVPNTYVNETALVTIPRGTMSSEWALECNGFRFGPMLKCEVKEAIPVSVEPLPHVEEAVLLDFDAETAYGESTPQDTNATPTRRSSVVSSLNFNKQSFDEDTDDYDDEEFVVVPDCFNLDKKWDALNGTSGTGTGSECDISAVSPTSCFDGSVLLSRDMSSSSSADNSYIEVPVTNDDDREEQLLDLEIDDTMVSLQQHQTPLKPQTVTPTPESLVQEAITSAKPIETPKPIELPVHTEKRNREEETPTPHNTFNPIPFAYTDSEPAFKKPTQATNPERVASWAAESQNDRPIHIHPMNAFHLMKDAFSNMRGPLYSTNLDIEQKAHNQRDQASAAYEASRAYQAHAHHQQQQQSQQSNRDFQQASNMAKLLSMGFANRALNADLLQRYDNDMDKVVSTLLENINDNWATQRH